jgi:hypothetical protein
MAEGVGVFLLYCLPTVWCERGDSNPHGFTRQILSLVRLPIPPLSHIHFKLHTSRMLACNSSFASRGS